MMPSLTLNMLDLQFKYCIGADTALQWTWIGLGFAWVDQALISMMLLMSLQVRFGFFVTEFAKPTNLPFWSTQANPSPIHVHVSAPSVFPCNIWIEDPACLKLMKASLNPTTLIFVIILTRGTGVVKLSDVSTVWLYITLITVFEISEKKSP